MVTARQRRSSGIARHLRDAHSAALMIGNERIHAAHGALHMVYRDDAI